MVVLQVMGTPSNKQIQGKMFKNFCVSSGASGLITVLHRDSWGAVARSKESWYLFGFYTFSDSNKQTNTRTVLDIVDHA